MLMVSRNVAPADTAAPRNTLRDGDDCARFIGDQHHEVHHPSSHTYLFHRRSRMSQKPKVGSGHRERHVGRQNVLQ